MTAPLFRLLEIEKNFDGKPVLTGINLEIFPGETLVILGGSGSGKSVLLKLLVGLLQANSGKVFFEEREITQLHEKDYYPVRMQVSYLFQGGALFDSMNVWENLAYPLREHTKLSNDEIFLKVVESLKMVELTCIEELYPTDLSGGMMKRVALARAIINQPRVVLYDEPTTGLDPLTTHAINRLIRKLQKELHITSVVVTHDMSTARHVADRLAFLEQGKLAFIGTMAEAEKTEHPVLRAFLEGGGHE